MPASILVADSAAENIQNNLLNARLKAKACLSNPLTPYINSDATARDMDIIRCVLGDDKLNYLGISYGTWLGTWYAGLFPEARRAHGDDRQHRYNRKAKRYAVVSGNGECSG